VAQNALSNVGVSNFEKEQSYCFVFKPCCFIGCFGFFTFLPTRKKEEEVESTHANIKEKDRQAHTHTPYIYKDHKTTFF